MPKQCPECSSFSDDDIGYCPGCARQLDGVPSSSYIAKLWQSLAVLTAGASIAGAAFFYFWRENGH